MLVLGGEWLVRGAASLAAMLKISPLVIGLTVVAFGTSAPELGVSLQAAFAGNAGVAVGNVVGSNIINILVVLGTAALVTPLLVSSQLVRWDVPLMVAASIGMWAAAADGVVAAWEGAIMFAGLVAYIARSVIRSRSEQKEVAAEFEDYVVDMVRRRDIVISMVFFVAGLIVLGIGSRLLVDGATQVAKRFGVTDLVIGLTVVAVGTSLPEVVTSVVASVRGQRDIAVGNVVGSNLFNILCVLGLTSMASGWFGPAPSADATTPVVAGIPVDPAAVSVDIPIMVAVAVLCLPIFWTSYLIRRWEATMFLAYYAAYTTFLYATATAAAWRDGFVRVVAIAIPLTLVPIVISVVRFGGRARKPPEEKA